MDDDAKKPRRGSLKPSHYAIDADAHERLRRAAFDLATTKGALVRRWVLEALDWHEQKRAGQ